ncbi:MAG: ABC transporter permease, partial [Candidatus Methylumidiphilus sp.]
NVLHSEECVLLALNLFEGDLPAFKQYMAQHSLVSSDFFPIIRGRFTAVNGIDVHTLAHKDSQGEGAANRDLSLTWSQHPPMENPITEGDWWGANPGPGLVSVEAKLADSLQIHLGDRLSFSIEGQPLQAVVSSLRSVRWDTMRPNFYMIFSPGTLNGFPARWLTSFYVPPERKPVLVGLAKGFPAVTLLEVDQLLKQFQTILQEISLSIDFVLVFALAAGFTVLFASVRATLDERLREDALLRAMGASRKLLRQSLSLEFAILGLLSGLLAAATTEAIVWALFSRAFGLQPRFQWEIWVLTPVVGALAVGLSGYIHTRGIVRSSPMNILREL